MNEAETRAEHIDPALKAAGWGVVEGSRIRREYPITPGRIEGHGRRGKPLTADYVLEYRNTKLAVIEAKAWDEELTEGVAQAKNYAGKLADPLHLRHQRAGHLRHRHGDRHGRRSCRAIPRRTNSGTMTFAEANAWRDRFAAVPFEDKGGSHPSRYYQDIAVERVMEAIAAERAAHPAHARHRHGQDVHRVSDRVEAVPQPLELEPRADRAARASCFSRTATSSPNQAYNAFSAFPEDALVRIEPEDIRKKGKVPKNGSLFFTIFQTFMSGPPKDGKPSPYFGEYPPDFFDFIVIDECHRGGANDESNWRGILEYFAPAVQLGLTATPKRKDNVDTYAYFGEPVYIYSLKEGINDGFLTPFKVKQISTTLDEYVYTPDDKVVEGEIESGKRYDGSGLQQDHRDQGTRKEARRDFHGADQPEREDAGLLRQPGPRAGRARPHQPDEDEQRPELLPARHGQRRRAGRAAPARFPGQREDHPDDPDHLAKTLDRRGRPQHPQHRADAPDQLDDRVQADHRARHAALRRQGLLHDLRLREGAPSFQRSGMGRRAGRAGARPSEPRRLHRAAEPADCGKLPASARRADPSPAVTASERQKIKVKLADGKERNIQHMMATTFWHPDGTPMSAQQFMEMLFGKLPEFFKNEDELRAIWSAPDTRAKLLQGLAEKGFGHEQLAEMQKIIDAEKSDLFDVLAHVAYALPPLTREERAAKAKVEISTHFNSKQQVFLDFVLSHYVSVGVEELDQEKLTPLLRLKYHDSIADAVADLGKPEEIGKVFAGFQKYLYERGAAA